MSVDDMRKILDDQYHSCGICRETLVRPAIDHCHSTGRVRGLLCHRCNTWLAAIESTWFHASAKRYLAKHSEYPSPFFKDANHAKRLSEGAAKAKAKRRL